MQSFHQHEDASLALWALFFFYFFVVFLFFHIVSASLPNDELMFGQNDVENNFPIIRKMISNDIKMLMTRFCQMTSERHRMRAGFYVVSENYKDYKKKKNS